MQSTEPPLHWMADTDWPPGFWGEGCWGEIERSLETYKPKVGGTGLRLGFASLPPGPQPLYANKKDKYKTEKWKEAHRKAAREHARRKRAERRNSKAKTG
jgi:hypothetical protein